MKTKGGGPHPLGAIIFDFDGVIADSEALANLVLAEHVTRLGLPTNLEDALARYMGRRWPEVIALIEEGVGRSLAPDFAQSLQDETLARFRTDLREVNGAREFILRFEHLTRCIASSSSEERLKTSLEVLGLVREFEGRVFSADRVKRGKPAPDIFLYAARQLGVHASACVVIEDSASGVMAARAAGMTVIGLCAASHVRPGHERILTDAGAHHVARTWADATALIDRQIAL